MIRLFALTVALLSATQLWAQPSDDDEILVPIFLTFEGLGATTIVSVPALRFAGLASDAIAAPPLRFQGVQSPPLAPELLVFIGLGTDGDLWAPALAFDGVETDGVTLTEALIFTGLGSDDDIQISALSFTGLFDDDIATQPMSFVGLGGEPAPDVAQISFVGIATRGLLRAPPLRFTGIRPPDPILTIEDFSGGSDGWVTNDGPQSLQIDSTQALCLYDNDFGDLTLFLPPAFLGDWGGPNGSFAFRAYYSGTTQWPIVITLHSPAGTAVFRASLSSYNDLPYADIERPLSDIWWEEDGDWNSIISDITQVSIVLDIKDGNDDANEICVDDFVLTRIQHL